MGCKLTQSLGNKDCKYVLAGASKMWLANWYPPVEGEAAAEGVIAYSFDTDGMIDKITLPGTEKFYEIDGSENTLSYADTLLLGGNGGKYRQHTINAVLSKNDQEMVDQGDALSLGRFLGVVLGKDGKLKVLGRTGGLAAPAGGMDFNSGAAEADAAGWTFIQQGSSTEIGKLLTSLSAISIAPAPEVVP